MTLLIKCTINSQKEINLYDKLPIMWTHLTSKLSLEATSNKEISLDS